MSTKTRCEYLKVMQGRYRSARRHQRSALLDEMEETTGLHRKSLIRLMYQKSLKRKPRSRQRGCTYGPIVRGALRIIAESFDYPCAERLYGNLAWMGQHLAMHGELHLTKGLLEQLERMSVSTIRRKLASEPRDQYWLPRSKPRPANTILRDIPMRRISWDEIEPGHFEVDLVFHSGNEARGDFICSLHLVDVATGWSELVAILGRSYLVIRDAFGRILQRLPFPIQELHPDNGSEFFNHYLMRFWRRAAPSLSWSRSRPFHKNDNRFVEQKNSSIIRSYFGYQRLDTTEQVKAMNRFSEKLWIYYNLFQPVLRVRSREMIPQPDGTYRVRQRYGLASTPLDRLCATGTLSQEHMDRLIKLRQTTNPRKLRLEMRELADAILRMPGADDSRKSQNVFETLHSPVTLSFERMTPLR
jgi:hypothetical protein